MAKKILAVVLAVAMALSAMAVTVFADKQIPLRESNKALSATSDITTVTLSCTIPVSNMYAWNTHFDAFDLTLPTNYGGNLPGQYPDMQIDWYVVLNGQPWKIQPTKKAGSTPDADIDGVAQNNVIVQTWDGVPQTYTQRIYFGTFTHNYTEGVGTTVPQTQSFGGLTSIQVMAELKFNGKDASWPLFNGTFEHNNNYGVKVAYTPAEVLNQVYGGYLTAQYLTLNTATNEYEKVPNSIAYLNNWTVTAENGATGNDTTMYFVSGTYFDYYTNGLNAATKTVAHPFTWDHNIENRGYVYGAEKVQLVVELNKQINGIANYTLYGKTQATAGMDTSGTGYDLWWNYDTKRQAISTYRVTGPIDKLVFDVPVEYLINAQYGSYNDEFAIFETVELFDNTLMSSPYTMLKSVTDATATGDTGVLSWNKYWAADGMPTDPSRSDADGNVWANYNGNKIIYAADGAAFTGISKDFGAKATNVYLNIVETAEPKETETVDQATEGGEGEGDNVDVGDTEGKDVNVGDTEPEQNPTTGVALAVVPMLVAAAAAVVCKKH